MHRIALHSIAASPEEYVETHARVPADLLPTFARAGIHDWTIWRSGAHLFHVVTCDDWPAALASLDAEPANARWQAVIGPLVRTYLDGAGAEGFAPLTEVWDLRDQRG